jgi:hypothetical protein
MTKNEAVLVNQIYLIFNRLLVVDSNDVIGPNIWVYDKIPYQLTFL